MKKKKLTKEGALHIAKCNGGTFHVHRFKWGHEYLRKLMRKWARQEDCPFYPGVPRGDVFEYTLRERAK